MDGRGRRKVPHMSNADRDVGRVIAERSWVPSPTRRQLMLASIRIRTLIVQLTRERTAGACSAGKSQREWAV